MHISRKDKFMITEISADNFEQAVLKSELPVLVCFCDNDSPPSIQQQELLPEVISEFSGKAEIFTVNVYDEPRLSEQYGIISVPTIVTIKDGKEAGRHQGLAKYNRLTELLNELCERI